MYRNNKGRFSAPQKDSSQDITTEMATYSNGVLTLTFTRPKSTSDPDGNDVNFTDSDCFYFFFPVGGGAYDDSAKSIDKHTKTPIISAEKICIEQCKYQLTFYN